jgi:hypothetical protein
MAGVQARKISKHSLATCLGYFPKMFRIALRVSSTTLRRQCAVRYATVSETIPDGAPVTATNREYVHTYSKSDLCLLKVHKQPKKDSGRLSVSRQKTVHQRPALSADADSA